MKKIFRNLALHIGRVDRRYVQLAFIVFTLVMLVIGGGAPDDGGGTNCLSCPY